LSASSRTAPRPTGELSSSENSLNQHIKLKHRELWEKLKSVESGNLPGLCEPVQQKEKSGDFGKNNEIDF
jgi:hypothetical protein